jgi:hypothetical protein
MANKTPKPVSHPALFSYLLNLPTPCLLSVVQ